MINKLERHKEVIIIGDFNINMSKSKQTTYGIRLENLFRECGFEQIVDYPTRITAKTKTTIDLIFSNSKYKISNKPRNDFKVSDHETIQMDIPFPYRKIIT